MEFLSEDSENPSSEGGDVKLGARTSKHIFVFVFGYLSQLYFVIIPCIVIIAYSYVLDIFYVFTLCVNPRELLKHLNSY